MISGVRGGRGERRGREDVACEASRAKEAMHLAATPAARPWHGAPASLNMFISLMAVRMQHRRRKTVELKV